MHVFLDYVAFGWLGLLPISNPVTSATVLLALSRLMVFWLVCIGVQFVIHGTRDLLQAWGFVVS